MLREGLRRVWSEGVMVAGRRAERVQRGFIRPLALRLGSPAPVTRLNLCGGEQRIPGYWNVDLVPGADLRLDLSRHDLPFPDQALDVVVCTSAINYFTRERAAALVRETWRVLRPGGIARFSVQDLELLARLYLARDAAFFFQPGSTGGDRFPGATLTDKFVGWFYGHETAGGPVRWAYDYDSLSALFRASGFGLVERRRFQDSRLPEVALIDNRPEQMCFLEAIK